jgi:hypothetical protein
VAVEEVGGSGGSARSLLLFSTVDVGDNSDEEGTGDDLGFGRKRPFSFRRASSGEGKLRCRFSLSTVTVSADGWVMSTMTFSAGYSDINRVYDGNVSGRLRPNRNHELVFRRVDNP